MRADVLWRLAVSCVLVAGCGGNRGGRDGGGLGLGDRDPNTLSAEDVWGGQADDVAAYLEAHLGGGEGGATSGGDPDGGTWGDEAGEGGGTWNDPSGGTWGDPSGGGGTRGDPSGGGGTWGDPSGGGGTWNDPSGGGGTWDDPSGGGGTWGGSGAALEPGDIDLSFAAGADPAASTLRCVTGYMISHGGAGLAAGWAAAETLSTACVGGGALVVAVSGGTTAPVAGPVVGVCALVDVTQIDGVAGAGLGGLLGMISGAIAGLSQCDNTVQSSIADQIKDKGIDKIFGVDTPASAGSLRCTTGVSNATVTGRMKNFCGQDTFALSCDPLTSCADLKAMAERAAMCYWGRKIIAETFFGGLDGSHMPPINHAEETYKSCRNKLNSDPSCDDLDETHFNGMADKAMAHFCAP